MQTEVSMRNELVTAIRQRRHVTFVYNGIQREALPVALGTLSSGAVALRCYQTAGGHTGAGHTWDLCKLENISHLQILSTSFSTYPPGYRRGDKQMIQIFAQL
jgi:hypothetical protein